MPPQATVFFQEACLAHRFIRSRDTSTIVERPQRIHAVKLGVAAAIARLEQCKKEPDDGVRRTLEQDDDNLVTALGRLSLNAGRTGMLAVVTSSSSVDILSHPAVKYIHGDIDGDVYLERLVGLVRESEEKVSRGESEIPEGLSQGDLYLCKESLSAIQGAIGTVCEAVDTVLRSTNSNNQSLTNASSLPPPVAQPEPHRAFVAIRPPGHHCNDDTPSGFCFVNNVAIGAAHAHLQYGIARVVILDIDLHHGNGTQSIVWQINEETHRKNLESQTASPDAPATPGLKIYYGSIHDVLSYPCEDGNPALIQAASVSLHGPHGQYIENVHLQPYESEADFWDRLYAKLYNRVLQNAVAFMKEDEGSSESIIFISAGFDASEYEFSYMSRHNRKVPTEFYYRFAHDVRQIADLYCKGRIVSVLEGGYSDRALCSGAMAHVLGLAEDGISVDRSWWSLDNLIKIEKASKKRRSARSSGPTTLAPSEEWLERMNSILSTLSPSVSSPPTPKYIPPSTMTLRERNKKPTTRLADGSEAESPPSMSHPNAAECVSETSSPLKDAMSKLEIETAGAEAKQVPKKLPRVVLKVNQPSQDNHA